jgi:plasmid stabilization system protein ParE
VFAEDVRRVIVKNYNIFYSVDEQSKTINILHILYNGMDVSDILDKV